MDEAIQRQTGAADGAQDGASSEAVSLPVRSPLPSPILGSPNAPIQTGIEMALKAALPWTATQPNTEATWAKVRLTADELLDGFFRAGLLQGTTAAQAYFVRCDRTTMTQDDLDNGNLVVLIGVATVRPAEFVILRIGVHAKKP